MNSLFVTRLVPTLAVLVVTSLWAVPAPAAAQSPKLAYVDSRAILDAAPGRVEAEAQLQKEGSAMQVTLAKLNDGYVAMMSEYTKLPATTAQVDRDKRAKTIQDKQAELQQKQQEFQDQYNQRQAELLQPILDQIKIALEDLRVEGSYTMIFDIGGQGASIVAADKNLNITDRAIAKLRTMPKPTLALRSDSSKADARKPAGAPLNAPAGVSRPGAGGPPAATPPRKPDSTATKKPDSTATKKPDSTAKKPSVH